MAIVNLGQLAYCAACIQAKTRKQGLGRILGDGDFTLKLSDGSTIDAPPSYGPPAPGTDAYNALTPLDTGPSTSGSSSSGSSDSGGGWASLFSSAGKSLFTGASSAGTDALKRYIDPGAYLPQHPALASGLPSWVVPAGIAAAALVVVLALKGRNGGGAGGGTVVVK